MRKAEPDYGQTREANDKFSQHSTSKRQNPLRATAGNWISEKAVLDEQHAAFHQDERRGQRLRSARQSRRRHPVKLNPDRDDLRSASRRGGRWDPVAGEVDQRRGFSHALLQQRDRKSTRLN